MDDIKVRGDIAAMGKVEKKQLVTFILTAYGVTFVLGFLMWFFYGRGADLSVFPNAQMFYPAAGVMLAYLVTKKEDKNLPKPLFIFFILLTAVMILCAVLSVFVPLTMKSGEAEISVWMMAVQGLIILGSVIFWILLLTSGKERRAAYGLRGKNWKKSFLCILLFFVLYSVRMGIGSAAAGQLEAFGAVWTDPVTWIYLLTIFLNFFLVVTAFFGEEYGWRYYLQPVMQKRFGVRGGVLLLGVVWGLWHLPIDFFYYTTPDMGLAACVSQQITCIFIGIFLAYVYMKTDNIWVPVAVHFLNNNLVPMFAGNYTADVLQEQTIHWGDLIPALLLNLVIFGWFIFLKPFRAVKEK